MTTCTESATKLQQLSRIRQQLIYYKSSFISLNYIDNNLYERNSCYDVWINLCLLNNRVIPAFIIEWRKYIKSSIFTCIMHILINYRDTMDIIKDIDYRLIFITSTTGIIVTTYYSYYKQKISYQNDNLSLCDLYQKYKIIKDSSLLNTILGIPNISPGNKSFEIYCTTIDPNKIIDPVLIFKLTYSTETERECLYNLYSSICSIIKIYDIDSTFTIVDSEGLLPGHEKYHISLSNKKIEICEKVLYEYKTYTNSLDRSKENWNNDFDVHFEMGTKYLSI